VWFFFIRRCNQERVTPLFFKRKEFGYPLGGGFGEGFDGCGMSCGVVIAAEPAGWLQQGLVCAAVMYALDCHICSNTDTVRFLTLQIEINKYINR
jgi:hypothetical protein